MYQVAPESQRHADCGEASRKAVCIGISTGPGTAHGTRSRNLDAMDHPPPPMTTQLCNNVAGLPHGRTTARCDLVQSICPFEEGRSRGEPATWRGTGVRVMPRCGELKIIAREMSQGHATSSIPWITVTMSLRANRKPDEMGTSMAGADALELVASGREELSIWRVLPLSA